MFQQLVSRSPDLKRLRDEGYNLAFKAGYLLVKQVPYVNSNKEVCRGVLVSELVINGNMTGKPNTHVAYFAGEHPCHQDGSRIQQIAHGSSRMAIGDDFATDHSFSAKPPDGYADYYDKITKYVRIIVGPAQALDETATAQVFPPVPADDDGSVFHYIDTASSRSKITAVTDRLAGQRLTIIGLGGTGSYVLDLVSKAPVAEIHLFDGDKFSNHNAFRSPGAASLDEFEADLTKVEYLARRYSKMHRHIVPHPVFIDATNVAELDRMTFVFMALDKGPAKLPIIEALELRRIPFVDVGMGIDLDPDDKLRGLLRVTASTPDVRDKARGRISFGEAAQNGEYNSNIQIADLNALNAALAVIKWKKLYGLYRDTDREYFSAYNIDGNIIINDDHS
jgi:hypothetical protein